MSQQKRFAHRLALALGHPYPRIMLRQMSAVTFVDWQRYASLEPFGEERADLRAGIVASTIANCLAGREGKAFSPEDFMPLLKRSERVEAEEKTPDQLFGKVKVLNRLMGGKFEDRR